MRSIHLLISCTLLFTSVHGHAQGSKISSTRSTTNQDNIDCRPFEGNDKAGSLTGVIFIGEHHGTKETPALFGSLICNAGKMHRHIHVAFEQPEDWTIPLSEFINSGDNSDALSKFLRTTNWNRSVNANPDGRTSQAFIELLQYLRLLQQSGYQLSISAFDTRTWEPLKTNSDVGMAAILTRNIEKSKADVTFVLAGEYHTRLRENTTPSKPRPMAFLVSSARPNWDVKAFAVSYSAGKLWGCSATSCGELFQPVQVPIGPPKLEINSTPDQFGYMGTLYVGTISSSSPYIQEVK